jgi:predicted ATPase
MPLLREVTIEGFKSIRKLQLELGRVNVLIGANGAGKSNVLEAIAYGVAGAHGKLDNEYLVPRGVRVTEGPFMVGAFEAATKDSSVGVGFRRDGRATHMMHFPLETLVRTKGLRPLDVARWAEVWSQEALEDLMASESPKLRELMADPTYRAVLKELVAERRARTADLPDDFLIYAPENSALRVFQAEPQVMPLGVRGEGLFAHLKLLSEKTPNRFDEIVDGLGLLDWFQAIEIPKDLAAGERSLRIRDRYLAAGALFDQRSANEGFLFLLFYLTLFVSDETPSFFAIDNVDTALNPKLATATVRKLVELASEHDKQVIFTTHSPAVLDALDLTDDEQRLLVADRDEDGGTLVRRVSAPKPLGKDPAVPLSEAFVRGYLGGLPEHF